MMMYLRPALVLLVCLGVLTGLVYPLVMTGVAGLIFPHQAGGSLIERDGTLIGSGLIGQLFTDPAYFHGRPSAAGAGYDATQSGGSNLGAGSTALQTEIKQRIDALKAENPQAAGPVPDDLVTASASGLDPEISLEAAVYQSARVAAARGVAEKDIIDLIKAHNAGRDLGILGEARVNVLSLNLALDKQFPKH